MSISLMMDKKQFSQAPVPLDQRNGIIWLDGKKVPWREAQLHVLSHGLHYGACVWEGERAYGGHIFKLKEHTQRLFHSAKILGMNMPCSHDQIEDASRQLIASTNLDNAYLRPMVWRGGESLYLGSNQTSIHIAIAAWEFPHDPSPEKGVCLSLSPWRRPPPNTSPHNCKTAGVYTVGVLAKQEAESRGYDDALLLDWEGNLAETTCANIFFVINNELHTPIPTCFLNGITRQTIIELACNQGIRVVERSMKIEDIRRASECFITGTALEVTPVDKIESIDYSKQRTITKELMERYAYVTRK